MAERLLDWFQLWCDRDGYLARLDAEETEREPREWPEPQIDMVQYLEGYAERLPRPRPDTY
jgi:hypothetical protein